jgi:hypothetical protein
VRGVRGNRSVGRKRGLKGGVGGEISGVVGAGRPEGSACM